MHNISIIDNNCALYSVLYRIFRDFHAKISIRISRFLGFLFRISMEVYGISAGVGPLEKNTGTFINHCKDMAISITLHYKFLCNPIQSDDMQHKVMMIWYAIGYCHKRIICLPDRFTWWFICYYWSMNYSNKTLTLHAWTANTIKNTDTLYRTALNQYIFVIYLPQASVSVSSQKYHQWCHLELPPHLPQ